MQMLHPHSGSIQQYMEHIDDPERGRPSRCPQCPAKEPLRAHGFYRCIDLNKTENSRPNGGKPKRAATRSTIA